MPACRPKAIDHPSARFGRRAGTRLPRVSELLTVEHFTPAVGEAFAVVAEGADGLAIELVEARGTGKSFQDREAFSLLFRGPVDPMLPQATYRLANARLGEVDIFLVPVAQTAGGTDYEAIFT